MTRAWGERLSAVAIICLAVYLGQIAVEFPAGGGTFPLFAMGTIVFLASIMIGASFLNTGVSMSRRVVVDFSYGRLKPILLTAFAIIYVFAIFELGYFASTLVFLVAATLMVGIRNYRAIALTAIILLPLMYGFFVIFLQADLPAGILM